MRRLGFVILAAGLLSFLSCGYQLVGSGKGTYPEVNTLAIGEFENQTEKVELGQRISERVVEEMARRGGFRISSRNADARLEGEILQYRRVPISFDSEGRANRYEVNVTVRVMMVNNDEEVLYESQHFQFRETYDRVEDPSRFYDQEILAFDIIAQDLARTLVSAILDGF